MAVAHFRPSTEAQARFEELVDRENSLVASDISAGVRQLVSARAGCGSRKHGGTSLVGNLVYCCAICNRLKGSDMAADGATILIRPSG